MNDLLGDASDEFSHEISLLRESHAAIEPVELDRAKVRARGMARRRRPGSWHRFVRSRAAVVAAITAGAFMSSGATAIGVSGLASNGSASTAQYGLTPPGSGTSPGSGSLPTNANGGPGNAVAPAQAVAQAGPSSGGELPFTGLALIPILLIGLALLIAGLVARRTAGRPTGTPPS